MFIRKGKLVLGCLVVCVVFFVLVFKGVVGYLVV